MNIIQDTLSLIAERLNDYFQVADPSPDGWVILSNLVDQDGSMREECRNKVVIFLANIQQDTTISTWNPSVSASPNRFVQIQPPIYINLFLLFYANFSGRNYPQGLGMMSKTIQFFQENSFFDHQSLPDLPPPVTKLVFELTNLNATELSYLMGLAGVKYLPSVYYKVRMFPFRSDVIQEQVSAVQEYSDGGQPMDPKNSSSLQTNSVSDLTAEAMIIEDMIIEDMIIEDMIIEDTTKERLTKKRPLESDQATDDLSEF